MVRVSVVVGTNGAVASKASVAGPTFLQVPATGGENVGAPTAPVIGFFPWKLPAEDGRDAATHGRSVLGT